MVRTFVLGLILLFSIAYSPYVYAENEIELVPSLADGYKEPELIYAKSTVSAYEAAPLGSRDILRSVPSITTADNKTMGIVIPPFAYFKTKF